MTLPVYRTEHIVQGEPLLVHAAEDFLGELTRQRPWVKARSEEVLEAADDWLSRDGTPGTLSAYLAADRSELLAALAEHETASDVLQGFDEYLREWRWI